MRTPHVLIHEIAKRNRQSRTQGQRETPRSRIRQVQLMIQRKNCGNAFANSPLLCVRIQEMVMHGVASEYITFVVEENVGQRKAGGF